jgi:hypothetical protein
LRPLKINEDHLSFKKSQSYDPIPPPEHHHHHHHHLQLTKRNNENFRKRKINTSEPLKEATGCNGITSSSQAAQRFQTPDNEPLLDSKPEPKRWHSLELDTGRTNGDEESSGCEERNGTSKKSLGRIKSWLVGILKSKSPNGQNELLSQQQQTSLTKNRNVDNESMSVV